MKNRDRLKESCYLHGGVDVLIMLIDFATLEAATPLTARQRQILDMYYRQGYRQHEIAEMMGLTRQTVCEHIGCAVKKLAKQYSKMMGGESHD